MKYNDISNRTAPVICFNLDSLLFIDEVKEKKGIVDKLLSTLWKSNKSEYFNRVLNKKFISIVNSLWYKYDFSIYFITKHDHLEELDELLYKNEICHTRVFQFDNMELLRNKVQYEWFLYVDDDLATLSQVGMNNVTTLKNLPMIIKTSRF